jgi:hypothetical protein
MISAILWFAWLMWYLWPPDPMVVLMSGMIGQASFMSGYHYAKVKFNVDRSDGGTSVEP